MKHFGSALILSVALSAGVLSADEGYVVGWGQNYRGAVTGTPAFPIKPGGLTTRDNPYATGIVSIAGQLLTNAIAISAGRKHALALRNDGTVVGWGSNLQGQAVGYETPPPGVAQGDVRIDGRLLSDVATVSAGWQGSAAMMQDGTLVEFGGAPLQPVIPDHSDQVLRELVKEQFAGWARPSGLSNVVAVSKGMFHTLAVKADGTVTSWGLRTNAFGGIKPRRYEVGGHVWLEHTNKVIEARDLIAIAASRSDSGVDVGLRRDGTVAESTPRGQVRFIPNLTNVIKVTAGAHHALALKADGTVFGWGSDYYGQATGRTNRALNHASSNEGLVTIDGTILSDVVSIATGENYNLALRKDGTVVGWGGGRFRISDVPEGLSNVVAIAVGGDFCLAITTNKAVAARFAIDRVPPSKP